MSDGGMMSEQPCIEPGFWSDLGKRVTAKVFPVLQAGPARQAPVIAYLRDLEVLTRSQSDSRDAVQILMSGRRLLGDRAEIGSADGPFSRT